MIFCAALLMLWIPHHKRSPTFLVYKPLVLRISSLRLERLLIEESYLRPWLPWLVLVSSLAFLMQWITRSAAVDTKKCKCFQSLQYHCLPRNAYFVLLWWLCHSQYIIRENWARWIVFCALYRTHVYRSRNPEGDLTWRMKDAWHTALY